MLNTAHYAEAVADAEPANDANEGDAYAEEGDSYMYDLFYAEQEGDSEGDRLASLSRNCCRSSSS